MIHVRVKCILFAGLFLFGFGARAEVPVVEERDAVMIGAGIMSATLATLLHELDPALKLEIYERLDRVAAESSGPLNNAGTGHAALAELNYTPQNADGSVEIEKAVHVAESFEVSKQYWGYLARKGALGDPRKFIHPVPHMSLVRGEEDVAFLKKRHEAMRGNPLFKGMEYSDNPAQLAQWIPQVMVGKNRDAKLAATRSELGTDVDFGALTEGMTSHLARQGTGVHLQHDIRNLQRTEDGAWLLDVYDTKTKATKRIKTKFVFIGAGGGSLLLLQKSGIPEARGFGGFPISGQFLICKNPALAEQFAAKIYGKAAVGSPPMSVPHLDTRIIDGQKQLVFGPFAGFSTKFLKEGSYTDLFRSLNTGNVVPMLSAGARNLPLTKYLLEQLSLSHQDRMAVLREFLPDAKANEWELVTAGQRVQVIKRAANGGGELQFGTEVVSSKDGSIAALLGASPGASTSVSVMLEVLENSFGDRMKGEWKPKLAEMIPSYGKSLGDNPELTQKVRADSHHALKLERPVHSSACVDPLIPLAR